GADRLHLVPLRVELQPVSRCRTGGAGDPAPSLAPGDDPEGLQRLQRAVPPRAADLHRHAVLRDASRRRALDGLPPVLRALPGTAGGDEPGRPPAESALPGVRRRRRAGPGRAAVGPALVGPARPPDASAPAPTTPAGPCR